jgi:hypothetical protein
MTTPFIPAEQLQRMITSALFQSLAQHRGVTPQNVTAFQLKQINTPSSGVIPPVVVKY